MVRLLSTALQSLYILIALHTDLGKLARLIHSGHPNGCQIPLPGGVREAIFSRPPSADSLSAIRPREPGSALPESTVDPQIEYAALVSDQLSASLDLVSMSADASSIENGPSAVSPSTSSLGRALTAATTEESAPDLPVIDDSVPSSPPITPGAFHSISIAKKSRAPDPIAPENLLGPPTDSVRGKKCLILDLDQTLIYSSTEPLDEPDLLLQLKDLYYVKKRPDVEQFIGQLCVLFEVVIFTASKQHYADPIIDMLDPQRCISARLYRDSCTYDEDRGFYVKDMSRLGRDLEQVLLVDDRPTSFSRQPTNGLACTAWEADPSDRELLGRLFPLLAQLADSPSVAHWRAVFVESQPSHDPAR